MCSVLFNAPAGPVLHRFVPKLHSVDISGSLGSGVVYGADGASLAWDLRLWDSLRSASLVIDLREGIGTTFPIRLGWHAYGLGPVNGTLDAALVSVLAASEGVRCTGQLIGHDFEVRLTETDLQGRGRLGSDLIVCDDAGGAQLFRATDLAIGFSKQSGLSALTATTGETPLASLSQLSGGQAELRVHAKGLEAIGMARVGSDLVMTMPFHMLLR